jgi:hypothetical protein
MAIPENFLKKLKRRLKVGPDWYKILLVPITHPVFSNPEDPADATSDGLTNTEERIIYLDENMHPDRFAVVLQHEITHCVNEAAGIEDGMDEEEVTTRQAPAMIQLWQDNPWLLNWFNTFFRYRRKG